MEIKKYNKKGLEISLNTIIIAIIAILVLVVLISFFLFGFHGLSSRVKSIFFGVTAGTDKTLAIQSCHNYCDQASLLPYSLRPTSAYCNTWFNIDEDNDGEAEYVGEGDNREYVKYYCHGKGLGSTLSLEVMCTLKDPEGRAYNLGDECKPKA